MGRLILVSNRLPFNLRRSGSETVLVRSVGGLVASLGPVHDSQDSLWIGSLGGELNEERRALLEQHRLVPVELPRDKARRHYEGFSNGVLWPLFHYFLESVEFEPEDFEAYRFVNERFADVIAEHARPGDCIWVHDYHLMLLPSILRQRVPDTRIGFFLHIPFPSSEVFRVLPVAEKILKGLLGSDLIGFHTYDYARHLGTAFRRILGRELDEEAIEWEGGRCNLRVFPLGINAARFAELAASETVQRRLRAWERRVLKRRVVLGVDRLDYSKGIPLRLEAYRRLLAAKPDWRKKVLFLQLAVPTRSNIPHYRRLKHQVDQKIGAINGEFGDPGMMPVHYLYRSVPPEELSALYLLADVCMVTPLRDGMNLVAKEYVASRTDDTGVLVLSEFAGTASELGEALVVNPWDLDATVAALDHALSMGPEEQHQRMSALRRRVIGKDARQWARAFIETLEGCATIRSTGESQATSNSWQGRLVRAFTEARRPLVVLGYDGTLMEFEPEPGHARPDPPLLELLEKLAGAPNIEVVLLSSRDRESLMQWFAHLPVHLVAEHGFFLRSPGRKGWEELAADLDQSWLPAVEEAMVSYLARTPGSFIERKHSGLAWHYRKADPELGQRQALELAHHLTEYFANRPVRVLQGPCVVEVHNQSLGKGWAYRTLLHRLGPCDFVLAAGDDRADEDMFRAAAGDVWSIKIGGGTTSARYRLSSPDRLRALLAAALQARKEHPATAARTAAPGGDSRERSALKTTPAGRSPARFPRSFGES
ncbi:MAG: bifunctional alpha,alpha-trehalose-phosphate synthase (UDP-forming)/trehalose-phosphatase [Acidobacteriota bacterium]